MVVTPATLDQAGVLISAAVMESDARYRGRIQLAPEAYAATGTAGGYIYFAMGADPRVADCGCAVLNRGLPIVTVVLSIMSTEPGGVPSQPVVDAVYKAIYARSVKLLTDTIAVNAAVQVPYKVNAVLNVLPGPDSSIIINSASTALAQMTAFYQRLSLGVPKSAMIGALSVAGVDSVTLLSPAADIPTAYNQFGFNAGTTISVNTLQTPFPQTEVGSFNT